MRSVQPRVGDIVGTIRRRLLVNSWADPAEVSEHLPEGMSPHLGRDGGVVVGCCMIEISNIRPWPLHGALGVDVRAAAHRISVEVGPKHSPTLAVYVRGETPTRHSRSLLVGACSPGSTNSRTFRFARANTI